MDEPERHVYVFFQIDTNRINARGNLDYMNQLEAWHDRGVIMIEMSETAQQEALQGKNAERTQKALSYIYSMPRITTVEERQELDGIASILSPDSPPSPSDLNDAYIVFTAKKYRQVLVTNDGASRSQPGGILGHRDELFAAIGVTIVTDEEAVAMVRKKIQWRDADARRWAAETGQQLPAWVGRD